MKKYSLKKGFTLIEMIVALAIFTIVALVAIGALLKITDANKKSITLKTAINNLAFTLESMSREMRVGNDYQYHTDSTGWRINFASSEKSADGACNLRYSYKYFENEQTIKKARQNDCNPGNNYEIESNFYELLSSNIKITDTFIKLNEGAGGRSIVFIWLKGHSGIKEKEKTEFSIQTSISQIISD